ncbi:hypothetical protein Moror_13054 [Moniliophthora roreri MCA 2997]|uniref:F-box domain-containing protein n=2 Tax=Moniliophthora roreri TaxID=221103 RepID=V2YQ33_MONRO|nr:hypothetical protein Moror_13054 [Moniliophthora roreri MCA 2997]KAI3604586.1 hypothetical protein WG66_008461 [Moniliophthora roreri]
MPNENVLERLELEVRALDVTATQLEEAAKRARQEYYEMRSLLNSRRNDMRSPFLKLPNELLLAIANHLADEDTNGHAFTRGAAPWVVSQISHRLRHLAVSTPSLWVDIRIYMERLHWCRCRDPLEMLTLWLDRSMPLPISCQVELEGVDKTFVLESKLLDLLMAHASRWLHIDINFGSRADLHRALATLEGPLSCLRSIRLDLCVEEDDYEYFCRNMVTIPFTAYLNAPNLVEASHSVNMDFDRDLSDQPCTIFPLPWNRLKEVVLLIDDVEDFFDVARLLENITYCRLVVYAEGYYSTQEDFSYLESETQYDPIEGTIMLPNLRRLELTGGICRIMRILRQSRAPKLTDLLIDPESLTVGVLDIFVDALSDFLQQSGSPLRALFAPIDLLSFPALTDNIQLDELHVLVSNGRFNPLVEQVKSRIAGLGSTALFPGLKTLHLISPHLRNNEVLSTIADVVEKRKQELKVFSLDIEVDVQRDKVSGIDTNLPSFKRLVELGRGDLEFLGRWVDGKWYPVHKTTTVWDAERYDRLMGRFRFGWGVRSRFGKYWT